MIFNGFLPFKFKKSFSEFKAWKTFKFLKISLLLSFFIQKNFLKFSQKFKRLFQVPFMCSIRFKLSGTEINWGIQAAGIGRVFSTALSRRMVCASVFAGKSPDLLPVVPRTSLPRSGSVAWDSQLPALSLVPGRRRVVRFRQTMTARELVEWLRWISFGRIRWMHCRMDAWLLCLLGFGCTGCWSCFLDPRWWMKKMIKHLLFCRSQPEFLETI